MRKVFLLLLLAGAVFAAQLEDHSIKLSIDEDGSASVMEEFTLSLQTVGDSQMFDNLSAIGATNVSMWGELSNEIKMNVLGERLGIAIATKKPLLGFGKVTIEYTIESFALPTGEVGRFMTMHVGADQFSFYDAEAGVFSLPAKADLTVELNDPRHARDEKIEDYIDVKPKSIFTGPFLYGDKISYSCKGPAVSYEFSIDFKVEKGIGEELSLQSLFQFLTMHPIYSIALIILVALVLIFRKHVAGAISESFMGEEEIELPKRE